MLARAARGRDIGFVAPRERAAATPAAPAGPPAEQSAAGQPTAAQSAEAQLARKATARPSRPPGWNDPELFMPTLEELEAQARRRPPGRTLVAICLDLAVVPGFCTGPFWNELFDAIRLHGGSVATLMQEKTRREKAFCKEQDRKPGSNWDWQEMGREALRRVLGFFIGEAADDTVRSDIGTICRRPRRWPPARPDPGARSRQSARTGPDHGRPRRSDSRLNQAASRMTCRTVAHPSWPGLTRPPTHERSGVDGRVKPGHDERQSATRHT